MKPSSKFDPCLTPIEDVSSELKNSVIGEGNKLDELLKKGQIEQATMFAHTVLMSVESASEQTDCGQALNVDEKTLVRAII